MRMLQKVNVYKAHELQIKHTLTLPNIIKPRAMNTYHLTLFLDAAHSVFCYHIPAFCNTEPHCNFFFSHSFCICNLPICSYKSASLVSLCFSSVCFCENI